MSILNLTHRFPRTTLIVILIITGFYASKFPLIKTDSSINGLLIQSDPDYLFYQDSRDTFGSDAITTVVFKDPELYSNQKLQLIQNFVFNIETWKRVEKIDSLFTSPHFENVDGTLQTVPLLDLIPTKPHLIDNIKTRALNNPFFIKTIINTKGDLLSVNIHLDESEDKTGTLRKVFATKLDQEMDKIRPHFKELFQIGAPKLVQSVDNGMKRDITYILPLSIFLILFILYLTMKSGISAIFPIVTGLTSIIWTIGQMALLDIPIQMLTSTIPLLLLVIGSTEDTHIIAEYDEALHIKKGISEHALNYLSQKISIPIILTTITTAVGFGTIIINDIKILYEFGTACSIGLIFNFIITVALSPILMQMFLKKPTEEEKSPIFDRIADKLFHVIQKYYKNIIFIFVIFFFASIYLATKVQTNNSALDMIKKSNPFYKNVKKLNDEVGGIFTYFLVLEAPEDKNFKDWELADLVFKIENLKNKYPQFISSQSYSSLLALIHREFTVEEKQKNFVIPKNTKLIHQYFLFLSPDDLRKFLTLDYKKANVVFRHNISESVKTIELKQKLEQEVQEILKGSGIKFQFTGTKVLTDKAIGNIIQSQNKSILIISLCVFFIILLLFRDFKIAFLALIPNISPIIMLFAFMGAFDIFLDIGTCNVAAVAIGIAADDTLHFLSRFEQNLKIYFKKTTAIQQTLRQEIRPISCTSLALVCGLSSLAFCLNMPAIKFGTLLAFCIFIAYLSDIFVTPLLMLFVDESKFVSITEIFRYRIAPYVIKSSPLFKNISIKAARNMIINGRILEFEKDQEISHITQRNKLLLIQGEISISRKSNREGEKSENILIDKILPGQVLNLDSVSITSNREDLTILPLNHCKAIILNEAYLDKIKNNYPEYSESLESNLKSITEL